MSTAQWVSQSSESVASSSASPAAAVIEELESRLLLSAYPGIDDDLLTDHGYQIHDAQGDVITDVADLMTEYAPVLKLQQGEIYHPKDVSIFASENPAASGEHDDRPNLYHRDYFVLPRQDSELWSIADLGYYAGEDYWSHYIDLPGDNAAEIQNHYDSVRDQYNDTIYATIVKDPASDTLAVQYWFAYYCSNWQQVGGFNNHEGDWEGVTLFFDTAGPVRAAYSQHHSVGSRPWSQLELAGMDEGYSGAGRTHPIVYVAHGSHASYFESGSTFQWLGTDLHSGDGAMLRPGQLSGGASGELTVEVLPRDMDADLGDKNWLKFTGRWGQIGLGTLGVPMPGFNGPRGPTTANEERWERPWDYAPAQEPTVGEKLTQAYQNVVDVGLDSYVSTYGGKPVFGVGVGAGLDDVIDLVALIGAAPSGGLTAALSLIKTSALDVSITAYLDIADILNATQDGKDGWVTVWLEGGLTGISVGLDVPVISNVSFGIVPFAVESVEDDPWQGFEANLVSGNLNGTAQAYGPTFRYDDSGGDFDWGGLGIGLFKLGASVDLVNFKWNFATFEVRKSVLRQAALGIAGTVVEDLLFEPLEALASPGTVPGPGGSADFGDLLQNAIEGDYTESYIRAATSGADDHGDAATSATPVQPGHPAGGVIESHDDGEDVDFFTFTAPSSGPYSIAVNTPDSSLDAVLTVFNSGGAQIAENDDRADGVVDPLVTLELIGGQTYSVSVAGYNGTETGSYLLLVSETAAGQASVVEVIDHSGSMSAGKLEAAKNAASLFADLMAPGDKVGVVGYSTTASTPFPLTAIAQDRAQVAQAKNAIDSLVRGGNTSIGAGVAAADAQLDRFPADPNRVMIVMTDGQQNTDPDPIDVINTQVDPDVRIFTIGFGDNAEADLLTEMADMRNGQYFDAQTGLDLQAVYATVSSAASGQQRMANTTASILPGEERTSSLLIDSSMSQFTIGLNWAGSDLDLLLVAPDGKVITHETAATEANIAFVDGATYEFFRIDAPLPGEWQVHVFAVDVPPAGEAYNLYGMGASSVTAAVTTDRSQYTSGQTVIIRTQVSDVAPIVGAAVLATVTPPAGAGIGPQQMPLWDDGQHGDGAANDGVYGNRFTDTASTGTYEVDVQVSGTTSDGFGFTRLGATTFNVGDGGGHAVTPQTLPYADDFGTKPEADGGWEYYSTGTGEVYAIYGQLRMHDKANQTTTYALNECILHLDLLGKHGVQIEAEHINSALYGDVDEPHTDGLRVGDVFVGHRNADLIAISDDGDRWYVVRMLTAGGPVHIDLDAAATAAGMTYTSDFQIKFQQYDNCAWPYDGRALDSIRIHSEDEITVADYFPLQPGPTWEYEVTNPWGVSDQTVTIDGPRTGWFPGAYARSASYNPTTWETEYFSYTGDGSLRYHGEEFFYSPIFSDGLEMDSPLTLLPPAVSLGQEYAAVGSCQWWRSPDPDLKTPGELSRVIEAQALESVTVPFGTFDCLRLLYHETWTDQSGGTPVMYYEETGTIWLAEGVGIVKSEWTEIDYEGGTPEPDESFSSVLVDFHRAAALPYCENFSTGKPSTDSGWEYYSTGTGEIFAQYGQLRLHDPSNNVKTYALNEAVLHLNLVQMGWVTLNLRHINSDDYGDGDELHTDGLRAGDTFLGHRNADLLAISDDGNRWYVLTLLGPTSRMTFDLDAAIHAAGMQYTSDFQIKFQQYDNTVWPYDGRAIDDICVTTVPILMTNAGLTVDEGGSATVDDTMLMVADWDNTREQLTYRVTAAPANGRLKRGGTTLSVGGTFTQADIDVGLLTYTHNGSETTGDGFTFTISDGFGGTIGNTRFAITVTPVNDAPVLILNGGRAGEGRIEIIDSTDLLTTDEDNTPAQIRYTLAGLPAHGVLKRYGAPLSVGGTFTQDDIDANRITYTHDGSKTTADSFTFTVSDGAGGTIGETTFDMTVGLLDVQMGNGEPVVLRCTEGDGTVVIVVFGGRGGAALHFDGSNIIVTDLGGFTRVEGDGLELHSIDLIGTTAANSLIIVASGGADNLATIRKLTSTTPIGVISAGRVDFDDGGIVMTGDAYARVVIVHSMLNGADIIMPGTGAPGGIVIRAAELSDGTRIELGSYLASLVAWRWTGGGLVAPWAYNILFTGYPFGRVPGDLAADLTFTGAAPNGYALLTATVLGNVLGGLWDLEGNVASIYVRGATAAAWRLNTVGYVSSLRALAGLGGAVTARYVNAAVTTGDLSAALEMTGQNAAGVSLGALIAGLVVGDVELTALGVVNLIRVWEWQTGGRIAAGGVNTLLVTGNRNPAVNLDGNLGADVTLTGMGVPAWRRTLGYAYIAGAVKGADENNPVVIRSTGSMGTVIAGTFEYANVLVGIAPTTTDYARTSAEITNTDATIGAIILLGGPGGALLRESHFTVARFGIVSLANVGLDNMGLWCLDSAADDELQLLLYRGAGGWTAWRSRSGEPPPDFVHIIEQ